IVCCYTGPIHSDQKKAIVEYVNAALNKSLWLTKALLDFHLYYLCHLTAFVDADFILQALSPQFSDKGSVRHQKEVNIINFLQDFLQNLEDQDSYAISNWLITHVPLIQNKTYKITVNFDHDCTSQFGLHTLCFLIVNACAVAITFPTQHLTTYADFQNNLTQTICGWFDFSRH
uniref:Uncharacterized protein n=1 Tax=Fundulus heteroclitus TaxID=8078 RepID=A0A3Q2U7C3_FUNHE